MRDCFGNEKFCSRWDPAGKIIYASRPAESWMGMPIGTGSTGAMVWAPNGLSLQVSHTDCWDGDGGLPSLARVEIDLDGSPFASGCFTQELDLKTGTITVRTSSKDGEVTARITASKTLGIIQVLLDDCRASPGKVTVKGISWRENSCEWQCLENNILAMTEQNNCSAVPLLNVDSGFPGIQDDPLLGLSRGVAIHMDNAEPINAGWRFAREDGCHRVKRVLIATAVDKQGGESLCAKLRNTVAAAMDVGGLELIEQEHRWWMPYWEKSAVAVGADSRLQHLCQTWYMHRYLAACSMSGQYPPKFNGINLLFEYDRRSWGGCYWFQNTRLIYWPLFKTGDVDRMMPFFTMYFRALEGNKSRVQWMYGHAGAVFPETMASWGAGEKAEKGRGMLNPYTRNYFTGSLELLSMMAEYFRYTKDLEFARTMYLPMAEEIIGFFFAHYPLSGGKLFLKNAQALETWHHVDNPADQIAGLKAVLPTAISVARLAGYRQRAIARWESQLSLIPDLPRGKLHVGYGCLPGQAKNRIYYQTPGEGNSFLPAMTIHDPVKKNFEDAELYSVFPFGLYGYGLPDYEAALETYRNRYHKDVEYANYGWSQSAIWAARLGLADEAARWALEQFSRNASLPGGMMTTPGALLMPGVPDCAGFDTSGAIAIAVNEMLMQDHTGQLMTLPAWPLGEEVSFRLHSASHGIVEREYKPQGNNTK
jgi:alpha-L-fucosidase 2